jgi:hypothetical protein
VKLPVADVVCERLTAALLLIFTLAAAIGNPLGSVTFTVSAPVPPDWAIKPIEENRENKINNKTIAFRFI